MREKNRLITDEKSLIKSFNGYFTLIIKHLHIERNEFDPKHVNLPNNLVLPAVNKFQKLLKYFESKIKSKLLKLQFSTS